MAGEQVRYWSRALKCVADFYYYYYFIIISLLLLLLLLVYSLFAYLFPELFTVYFFNHLLINYLKFVYVQI